MSDSVNNDAITATPADFTQARWRNEPTQHSVQPDHLTLVTEPNTDLWQRSFYGFRVDNAPALLWESAENPTLTVRTSFEYRRRFDQCGVLIYRDPDHWFKASIEYEDESLSRLGSVVTNRGYSDWASTDIAATSSHWYRLSRRGPDFLVEHSPDGRHFQQMRVFHLHDLGETTPQMGSSHPSQIPATPIRLGVYACSPQESSFQARFDNCTLASSRWQAHGAA